MTAALTFSRGLSDRHRRRAELGQSFLAQEPPRHPWRSERRDGSGQEASAPRSSGRLTLVYALLEHGAQLGRVVVVMHGDSVLHSSLDQFVLGVR